MLQSPILSYNSKKEWSIFIKVIEALELYITVWKLYNIGKTTFLQFAIIVWMFLLMIQQQNLNISFVWCIVYNTTAKIYFLKLESVSRNS